MPSIISLIDYASIPYDATVAFALGYVRDHADSDAMLKHLFDLDVAIFYPVTSSTPSSNATMVSEPSTSLT